MLLFYCRYAYAPKPVMNYQPNAIGNQSHMYSGAQESSIEHCEDDLHNFDLEQSNLSDADMGNWFDSDIAYFTEQTQNTPAPAPAKPVKSSSVVSQMREMSQKLNQAQPGPTPSTSKQVHVPYNYQYTSRKRIIDDMFNELLTPNSLSKAKKNTPKPIASTKPLAERNPNIPPLKRPRINPATDILAKPSEEKSFLERATLKSLVAPETQSPAHAVVKEVSVVDGVSGGHEMQQAHRHSIACTPGLDMDVRDDWAQCSLYDNGTNDQGKQQATATNSFFTAGPIG